MNVYKTTDPEDISSILNLVDDRLEGQIPCSKIEWVQWLMQNIDKEEFLAIWVAKESQMLMGYMVALNALYPPISASIMILYQSFFSLKDEENQHKGELVLAQVKKWAMNLGATKISIVTKYPRINSKFGFKEEGTAMVLEL